MLSPKLRRPISLSPKHRALLRKLASEDCVHKSGKPNLAGWLAQTIEIESEDREISVSQEEIEAEYPKRYFVSKNIRDSK